MLAPGKDYGRQCRYGTNLVFCLEIGSDNELRPVVPPVVLNHPPSELYEALQTEDDVLTVLGPQTKPGDKIRLGWLIAAARVALFLMYLSASA